MRPIGATLLLILACSCASTPKEEETRPAGARPEGTGAKSPAPAAEKAPAKTPGKSTSKRPAPSPAAGDKAGDAPSTFSDTRPVPVPTDEERREFDRIWEMYRRNDPRWPVERDRFRRRSDAAGYLLAGHLMRHYMQVNSMRDRAGRELVRVKNEVVETGEPSAPALVDLMVLAEIERADGARFVVDDLTRQDCVDMLERIGPPAVPSLLRALARKDLGEKGRRLVALALGGTRDGRALDPLVKLLRSDPAWQVRADAATGLGKLGDRRALPALQAAVQADADAAVVKRAGKARYQILERAAAE